MANAIKYLQSNWKWWILIIATGAYVGWYGSLFIGR